MNHRVSGAHRLGSDVRGATNRVNKNYLFAGSDEAAERAALIYTVLANCKLAGVEPWAYLNDGLPELAQLRVGMKAEDVVAIERGSHLGPHEWLAARRVVVPAS